MNSRGKSFKPKMATYHSQFSRASSAFTLADRLERAKKDTKAVRDIWLFLSAVIVFFTAVNVSRKLYSRFAPTRLASGSSRSATDVEKTDTTSSPKLVAPRSRASRVFSSTATAFRIVAFRWAIPIGPRAIATVSELVFIIGYLAANFTWLFLDTRNATVNFFKSRAALVSCAQLPLIIALAHKNNIISWMTGISHEKLNVLHRAAGRTMFIMLWIHTIGRATTSLPPKVTYQDPFMIAGIIGISALTAGVFLSLRIFRHALFEFFFVTHVVFMLMFLVGGYLHLHEHGYGVYIWPSLLVWGIDRAFRFLRLVWHNRFGLDESMKGKASVELLTQDTIRVTFKRKFTWKPGQHAYISIPKISKLPSEAHPFTIASIPGASDGTKTETNEVVFLIRVQKGLTRLLKEHASQTGNNSAAAYVDGPYGSPPCLHRYTTCVLVAGGSGISYTLPLLLDLIRRSSIGGSLEVRRVLFVWAVRGDGHLPWITETLSQALATAKQSLEVDVRIYITGANVAPAASPSGSLNSISKSEKDEVFIEPEAVAGAPRIHHGRPDITTILHDEISASSGDVSVDVAGPGGLTTSVRKALTTGVATPASVLKGNASVTLHVETFGMVRS